MTSDFVSEASMYRRSENNVMDSLDIFRGISQCVMNNDGIRLAELFTENGHYDDYVYGPFKGRQKIAEMVGHLHRDGDSYRWEFIEAVRAGNIAFAPYRVSFIPKISPSKERILFDGIARVEIDGTLIASYSEIFDRGMVFSQQDFNPERVTKLGRRYADALRQQPEWEGHI